MVKIGNGEWNIVKKIVPLLAASMVSIASLLLALRLETKEHSEKGLCINEVCEISYAHYQLTGAGCGYVELYNPTSEEISLDNYYVTNDKKKKENRAYLKGLSINPQEHLILIADGAPFIEGEAHIPVLLEEKEETIYLLNNSGVIVDFVEVPKLDENVSYYRKTDGSSHWVIGETTPGKNNEKSDLQCSLKEPVFSLESGFYQGETFLEISFSDDIGGMSEGNLFTSEADEPGKEADIQIFYTLDGSMPSEENGILYTSPLRLNELSLRENIYANRQDVSVGFLEDQIIEAGQSPPGYEVPGDDLDKAVIVRAVVVNRHSGSISRVVTRSYFMDYQNKQAYDDLAVISMVTEPDNLFNPYKGIYVTGDFWDRTGPNEEPWEFWHANYTQSGPTWERPAQIEYFDENKMLKWSQRLGIRVRGLSSRSYAQKGFRLHARESLDGKKYITYPFFSEGEELESIQLTNAGNDTDTKLKDYLMSELIPDRNFSNPQMIPCAMFLNGEYWGMYYIAQNYDESYIYNYYGVEEDNVVIIKNGDVKEGTIEDLQDYHEFEAFVRDTDFSIEENYQELCRKMDIQSYLDYYCTQIYISRKRDWPQDNFALWKSRTTGPGAYEDSKWRWMFFDANTEEGELEEYLADFNTIAEVDFHNEVFHALMQIPEVKKQFVLTMMDLYNGYFKAEKVIPVIDDYENSRKDAMLLNLNRFYGKNKGQEEFESGVDSIRNFFLKRSDYLTDYMKNDLNLEGELAVLTVQTNLPEAGEVIVNTINAEFDDRKWQGCYFTDYPVILRASAKEGYTFLGWEGDIQSEEMQIEVTLKPGGSQIKAVYEKNKKK